jgi:hypothetical protein
MALLWIEGFEGLQSGYDPGWWSNQDLEKNLLRRYWRASSLINGRMRTTEGRFGGYGLEFYPGFGVWFQTAPLTTDRTLITGCALRWGDRNGGGPGRIVSLYDGDNLEGMQVRVADSGINLEIWRGNTVMETLTGAEIPEDEWFYIEFKVYCDNTNGTWELRLNGNVIGSASGVDTQASITNYHQTVQWNTNYCDQKIDDIYICDGSGSKNNDFLGVMRVIPAWPGTDQTIEWETMVGAPDHPRAVNEQEPDDDTSYIEDDDVGDKDIFDYAEITDSFDTAAGLMINTLCRETDAQSFDLINIVRSNGTEYDQPSQKVGSSSYVHRYDILESDPATGLDWTKTGIDSAQYGVKVD